MKRFELFKKGERKNVEKEINNYCKNKTYTLDQTRVIVNTLVNTGLIGEETVEEHMANDDLLKEVILRPGFNSVTFKPAAK